MPSGLAGCRLHGSLSVDGAPAEGWLALFQDAGNASAPVPFAAPGTFELSSARSGEHVLFLTTDAVDPAEMMVILDRVTLAEGPNEWSLELETGALEGRIGTPGAPGLLFHQWERGELRCLALLLPDASGAFRRPRVPAGKTRIVRYDPNTPLDVRFVAIGGPAAVPEPSTLGLAVIGGLGLLGYGRGQRTSSGA